MKTFTEPQYVLDARNKRALVGRARPCGAGTGNGLTCNAYPAALYPRGYRCTDCATAERLVVGRAPGAYPEHLQERRAAGHYRTASMPTITDQRAEASGKRDPNRAARRNGNFTADPITDRFLTFHAQNPHVYDRVVELVADAILAGHKRIGVGALFERLRYSERTETNGDAFRLNNDFRAPLVRLLVDEHPEWRDLFELRERKAS